MKKKVIVSAIVTLALASVMAAGCNEKSTGSEASEPVAVAEPGSSDEKASQEEPVADLPAEGERADGERFEETIMIEGMEETVYYEHVLNISLGISMDYDYETFERFSESDCEKFVSVYDDAQNPENYLEITASSDSADTVVAAITEELSQKYDVYTETRELDNAGSCKYLEASVIKGTNNMADQIQTVYIIPAPDGCKIARAHYAVEAAEGFGSRFHYLLNTLTVNK